jgi:Xaa-Pro aminopeptidase
MLVSDEPGIYKEGKYGIRIENILLVREKCETPDGRFLYFECLTYVPLDENLLLREEMSDREIMWLDHYQNACNSINSQS